MSKSCTDCGGSGRITLFSSSGPCDRCGGSGREPSEVPVISSAVVKMWISVDPASDGSDVIRWVVMDGAILTVPGVPSWDAAGQEAWTILRAAATPIIDADHPGPRS